MEFSSTSGWFLACSSAQGQPRWAASAWDRLVFPEFSTPVTTTLRKDMEECMENS